MQEQMEKVLAQAARLQQLVPDAVLVGGTAAFIYAGHRHSFDHDHIVADLEERFDLILDALEREKDWITNRTIYGTIILGELGGIEAGLRRLIRKRALEFQTVQIGGHSLVVPTLEELIRIKAYLITKRNQTRDYLDFAALSDKIGTAASAKIAARIDDYYSDGSDDSANGAKPTLSQLLKQLSVPQPKDLRNTADLSIYKGVVDKWREWSSVVDVCKNVAIKILGDADA